MLISPATRSVHGAWLRSPHSAGGGACRLRETSDIAMVISRSLSSTVVRFFLLVSDTYMKKQLVGF